MTTCAVCREEMAFRRVYIRDVSRNVLVATHLHVCYGCSRFDVAPKIRVLKKTSVANQHDYDIEKWRLDVHKGWGRSRGDGRVDLPIWGEMTTDEKVLVVIAYWDERNPWDGCHLKVLKKYVDVKRTTLHMSIKRLIERGQIVVHVCERNPWEKADSRPLSYHLAPED